MYQRASLMLEDAFCARTGRSLCRPGWIPGHLKGLS
jgi:hypothetical protein